MNPKNTTRRNQTIARLRRTLRNIRRANATRKRNAARNRRVRPRYRMPPSRRNGIPIATAQNFKRDMYATTITNTTARVSGSDLVYKIPDTLPMTADTTVIAVIPANPAYWLGTKIAAIARGYQNYRPVKFNVHYKPHCAATQAGNIIAGTIYHEAPSVDNLQQSLKTSNGGIMTQVFKPAMSHVKVGTNLQKNLYRIGGEIDDDSMPFYYMAIAIACRDANNNRINPGYFYVDYTYIFKNPIGGSQQFANSGISLFTSQLTSMKQQNAVAILCEPLVSTNMTLSIGTLLDIEYHTDNQSWYFYYNGTEVVTPNVYMWILSNDQGTTLTAGQMKNMTRTPIEYISEQTYEPQQIISIPAYKGISYNYNNNIHTFTNTTNEEQFMTVNADIDAFYNITNTEQSFGTYYNIGDDTFMYFIAPITEYYLKLTATTKCNQLIAAQSRAEQLYTSAGTMEKHDINLKKIPHTITHVKIMDKLDIQKQLDEEQEQQLSDAVSKMFNSDHEQAH